MATENSPTARARMLLEEIAGLADTLDRECFHGPDPHDDVERYELLVLGLRRSINQMGWMADTGSRLLGGSGCVRGSADKWLLPPVFNESEEACHG